MCVCCKSLWANQIFQSSSMPRNLIILLQLQRHILHLTVPARVHTVLLSLTCFYGKDLLLNFHSVVPQSIPPLNDKTFLPPKLHWAISLWFYTLWEIGTCKIGVGEGHFRWMVYIQRYWKLMELLWGYTSENEVIFCTFKIIVRIAWKYSFFLWH